jgi:hypothetical protein
MLRPEIGHKFFFINNDINFFSLKITAVIINKYIIHCIL